MTEATQILKEYLLLTNERKRLEDELEIVKKKLQNLKNKAASYIRSRNAEEDELVE